MVRVLRGGPTTPGFKHRIPGTDEWLPIQGTGGVCYLQKGLGEYAELYADFSWQMLEIWEADKELLNQVDLFWFSP